MSSSQQVDVEVVYGLATMLSRIDHSAIATMEPFRPGDLGCGPMQVADQRIVLFAGVGDGGDVLAGNDKDVNRGLWIDIGEGIALVVLVYGLGGNASINDLTKDTAHV